jgi:pectin methylesterase-like acyl-CoA thioesterase
MIPLILSFLLISQTMAITDLYVGYPEKENNFKEIQSAINEAASIKPEEESQRVIIHIAPGIYRQQLKIETPYITLLNEEPKKK